MKNKNQLNGLPKNIKKLIVAIDKDLNSIALREKYKDVFEQFDEKYIAYKQEIEEQEKTQKHMHTQQPWYPIWSSAT